MQRVALARGLAVGADVLLADEPTSELDEMNRGLVLAELRAEAARGAVVVVATHDPAVVEACDRHYTLDDGRLVDRVAAVDLAAWTPPERRADAHRVVAPAVARPHPLDRGAAGADDGREGGPDAGAPAGPGNDPDDSLFRRPSVGP